MLLFPTRQVGFSNVPEELSTLLDKLRTIRPQLDCYGKAYRDAGLMLLELKKRSPHGQYLPLCKEAGYSPRLAQICVFIAKAEVKDEELNQPINSILTAIRKGQQAITKERLKARIKHFASKEYDSLIIQADSLEWMKAQRSHSVSFIISDPPYGVGKVYGDWEEPDNAEDYFNWFLPYWNEMCRLVQPGGIVVIWQSFTYLKYFHNYFKDCLIDCLPVRVNGSMKVRTWIPLIRWHNGKFNNSVRVHPNFGTWVEPPKQVIHDYREVHPCAKNPGEVDAVLQHYTTPGSLVLDPFCGSGAIPEGCKKLGRKFIGVERNPDYVKITRARLCEAKE